jgi:hypothetical protein
MDWAMKSLPFPPLMFSDVSARTVVSLLRQLQPCQLMRGCPSLLLL